MKRPRTPEELIVRVRPEGEPRPKGGARGGDARGPTLAEVVRAHGCSLRPLFGASRGAAPGAVRPKAAPALGAPGGPLDGYYCVLGPGPELRETAEQVRALEGVAGAYVRPGAELATRTSPLGAPATTTADATGDFRAQQKYLGPPPGLDVRAAWATPGALGDGVRIIDVEWAWHFGHEDLAGGGGVVGGAKSPNLDYEDHGTAVLGVLGARHDARGVEGMVPHARVDAIALPDASGEPGALCLPLAEAIGLAADRLRPGDILLLEVQVPGPRHGFAPRDDQAGYIAPEWWPDVFAAIFYATARGVLVVEAAGNGAEDLDDALYAAPAPGFPPGWSNPFVAARPSGAIVVAAGTSDNRRAAAWSNAGARVDAQGWGERVVTTGYGHLADRGRDRKYTHLFGGTSSAAALVAGALACVQGSLRHRNMTPLDAAGAARLLRGSGLPPPAGARIGNRPNVATMIELALRG